MTHLMFNEKGFTLLEVIGGMLVFAFGILALYRAQIAAITTNAFAHELTQAALLVQEQLENLLRVSYDDPIRPGNPEWPLNDRNLDGTDKHIHYGLDKTGMEADFSTERGKFQLSWNIAVDQPISGNKTVRLIIQWSDKKDILHSLSVDCVKGVNY